MSANWPSVNLGDYCTKIGSGATPRGGASVYLDKGDICLIRSQNIYNEGFKPGGLVFITEESAQKLKNVIVEESDVLLNITGDSVARVCLAKKEYLPARVNQHVMIIRPDPNEFDSRYIRYLLASPQMQNLLLSIAAVGATRNALTKNMIETLEVSKPPISIQVKIANHLELLERKIELNQNSNRTLEAIAQALFKSWFVDFDPVKAKIATLESGGSVEDAELAAMSAISSKSLDELAELEQDKPKDYEKLAQTASLFPPSIQESELGGIPKGWSISSLKKLSEKISKGTTPSKPDMKKATDKSNIPFIKVKDISNAGEVNRDSLEMIPASIHEKALKRSILETDDILFSIAGTIGRVSVIDEDLHNSNANQAIAFIRLGEKHIYLELCYLALKSQRIQNEINSKVVQGVQANASLANIGDILIAIPKDNLLKNWKNISSPLIKQKRELAKQSRNLKEICNTLLPKLLSGEIDLSALNEEAGEVNA